MVQDNDILQFTVFAELQGQQVLNVFHYLYFSESASNPALVDIGTAWGVEFDTNVVLYFSEQLQYTRLLIENLTDGLEFSDASYDATGDQVGDTLPVHDTMSVKLLRSNKLTRNGRKSFSGLVEPSTSAGNILFDAATLGDIEDFCGNPLSLAVTATAPDPVILTPVIVGRSLNAEGKYELDLTKINPIVDAIADTVIATQNTRKR